MFGNPISKKDATTAAIITVRSDNPGPNLIQKQMNIGIGKAKRLSDLMADAGVTIDSKLILKNAEQAVNATLRQLNKGKK